MASAVAMAPSPQAASIDCVGRTCKSVSGSSASMLASSFWGDRSQLVLCPCSVSHGKSSRTVLALFVRMDSRGSPFARDTSSDGDDIASIWNADKSRAFPIQSQRAAVSTIDYVVADNGIDMASFRKGRGLVLEERSEVDLLMDSDDGAGSAEGTFVAGAGGPDISRLGLEEELVKALAKRGITHLFPIQEAVLKPAMDNVDIIGRAKTGTGKTLAFGIPIIQNILVQNGIQAGRHFRRVPQALVLAPTRELAIQVEKEFMESAPSLSTICVYGGVSITAQQRKLQKGVDIVVGTPGRIIDLIERGSLVLNEIRYMVLDEADQMLAVGFEEDVEKILEELPTDRQSMLFSATMPSWVSKLAKRYLRSPLNIDLVGESEEKLAEGIKIFSVATAVTAKRSILSDLITVYAKGGKTIVFTQTKKDADDIALSMSRMLGTEALHGDISQAQREKTLKAFRNGKFTVLVATDVAARGLDIPNVDLIIHFEIPNDPETFVHRSGRTGRAGKEGITILMHSDSQSRTVRMIERDVGCKFERIGPPNVSEVLKSSSDQAEEALNRVHPELKSVFLPTAERLLKERGPGALAAAIAHLSGFTQPPSSRSLITHQEGWMTLQITRMRGWGGRLSSVRNVMGTLSSIYQRAADEVGKIHLLDEQEGDGAVFDLPEDAAKELLTKELPAEDSIIAIGKLPRLLYNEDAPRDRYGRFSQRTGGGRLPGKSDRPFGSRTQSDRSFGTRTQSDRSFGSRTHSDRSFGTRDWNQGKRQDDDWNISRRHDDRSSSSSWNDNRSRGKWQEDESPRRFSLQGCFICGEPGHRAAVCPQRK